MTTAEYIRSLYVREDEILRGVLASIAEAGMPEISVAPESGQLLTLLVKISGARHILEIGSLGGYSSINLLRGTDEQGHLTSLEISQKHIDVARQNVEKAGFAGQVTYYEGDAVHTLDQLAEEGQTFDFFFIDADKGNYTNYLYQAVRLAQPGAIITADNTLFHGRVIDEHDLTSTVQALRSFNEQLSRHPQLESMLIPIGDGLSVARVKA